MKIGIDIDNTLTDVQAELNRAAYNYAKTLGKNIDEKNLLENINNNANFYKEKFKFNYEELKYFLKYIQEDIINRANPRDKAVETIRKLKNEGHKIYIITARAKEYHDDPYMLSKKWLDENNIVYDKLIVDAIDKTNICKKEKIDIFIDDQLHNCIALSNVGIKTIRISKDKKQYDKIITLDNWNSIYKYIIEME